MTREERENAIKCLKLWIKRESQLQTYKTCLEALEQEPSSDAVSREAVDDILCLYSDGNGMIDAGGAVRMVRELPSVNPQEPCEDAISRQAVQTELKNCEVVDMYDENDNLVGYYNAETVDSIVRNLPSVKPQEPKTGHWIKVYEAIGLYRWKCDKCKKHHRAMYDYCPSCGARMVEPQESEDKE